MSTVYSWEEVKRHMTLSDGLWLVIHGNVYDVTKFALEHPGGEDILIEHAGKEAGADFDDIGHSKDALKLLASLIIGTIEK